MMGFGPGPGGRRVASAVGMMDVNRHKDTGFRRAEGRAARRETAAGTSAD